MMKHKSRKYLELFLYIFLIFIFIQNLILYNLKFQHDAQLHHYPIFDIITLNFDEISTPYGILYYLYVSLFSIFSYPFYKLQILDPRSSFYLMVKISNLILYISSIYFATKVAKKIFEKKIFFIVSILLIFSMSSFQRSFLMVRPENLIILCTFISFYFLNKLLLKKNLNLKNLITIIIVLFLIGSAKINGFYYLLVFFFFLLIFCENNIQVLKISLIVFALIYLYYFLHGQISLMGIYDRPYGIDEAKKLGQIGLFNLNKGFEVFYNFSLIEAWNNPFKYSHSDSMINTLSLDLYGDYYGFGTFNHLITDDGIWTNSFKNCLIKLNRASIVLSCSFLFLFISSIFFILKNLKKFIKTDPIILFFVISFFSGIILLIAYTIFEYYGAKSTTFKWEYINFLIMGSGYVICFYSFKLKKNTKIKFINLSILSFIILFGYYQLSQFRC